MDSIYALSSGRGPSGVAVVRMSGPATSKTVRGLAGSLPEPRRAELRALRRRCDGALLDRGLVLWFPGPSSFTGEDCAELHVHGGRAVLEGVFAALTGEGLRMAAPGEFTRRAFLNNKLDLTQAEGIADLVAAETEIQRRQALVQADGQLSRCALGWREKLIGLRAEIEARLDFSDEGDVPERIPDEFWRGLAQVRAEMRDILADAGSGERVRDGFRVAILGRPNAGKSSLLNALAGREVAIVTEEAGTTRDVLEVPLDLGGYPVLLFDTAGLRAAHSAAEREGVARARRAAEKADLMLWLSDSSLPAEEPSELPGIDVWRISTKVDLPGTQVHGEIGISVRTGAGLADLLERLAAAAAASLGSGSAVVSRQRQREAIQDALAALDSIDEVADEIAADLLRQASGAIGRLSGQAGIEAILDRVFRDFCIGK